MAKMEIERKFIVKRDLLKEYIGDLNQYENYDIEQVYIIAANNREIRIRKETMKTGISDYIMVIKSGGSLSRNELNIGISMGKYQEIIDSKLYDGIIIKKTRYLIPLGDNLKAELDIYFGDLFPLQTVEVEFDSTETAYKFIGPKWFGEDVTFVGRYKNKSLALNPDGFKEEIE